MAKKRVVVAEDFAGFAPGHLHADFTAQGEYYCLPRPSHPNGWYDPINHTGRRVGTLERDQSSWRISQSGGRKMLQQTIPATHEPYVLVLGDHAIASGRVACELQAQTAESCGLIFDYQHSRRFVAVVLHGRAVELVVYEQSERKVLGAGQVGSARGWRRLGVALDGGTARVQVDGRTVLKAGFPSIGGGKVGLIANGPCRFRRVVVRGEAPEPSRPAGLKSMSRYPAAELRCAVELGDASAGRQVRFADLDGDGREEMVFAHPAPLMGERWRYWRIACLTAVDLDGRMLWRVGEPPAESPLITTDLPFQAADVDGDGRVEVVAALGDQLHILDGQSGRTKRSAAMPKPPQMEPYWDELSQYWGDGHGDDLPLAVPDALRLCNLSGGRAFGDILAKDRYHCLWALDGGLQVQWMHRCVLGHYPYTADLDGDGRDEIMAGYSRLNWRGELTGRLVLGDHPDACFMMKLPGGVVRSFHPAGEEGLVIADSDGRFAERRVGHAQHLSLGNFLPERGGLALICVTYWGNPGIVYLCDLDGRELRTREATGLGSVCQPVNWTGDGRDLILLTPALDCGGLYDGHFERVVPLPERDRPSLCAEVRDMLGEGVDQVIVWDKARLFVYGPARVPAGARRYRPIRPRTNQSNYMVYYSLPPGGGPAAE